MSYEIPLKGMNLLKYEKEKRRESYRRHARLGWKGAEAIEQRMGDPDLDAMWGRGRLDLTVDLGVYYADC